jgi:hypothetical protein
MMPGSGASRSLCFITSFAFILPLEGSLHLCLAGIGDRTGVGGGVNKTAECHTM